MKNILTSRFIKRKIGGSLFLLFVLIFMTGCSNVWKNSGKEATLLKAEEQAISEKKITPFEKAEELKNDFYEYSEIMEELKREFPNKEIILTESEKKRLFPEQMIGQSFPCHGKKSAYFSSKDMLEGSTEVEWELNESKDKLSIKINEDDTISIITTTAVEFGQVEGEKWKIIANNKYSLIAHTWGNDVISTITISKKTGLGVWQKTTASGVPMSYEVPTGQMLYLQCYFPKNNK